MSCQTRSGLVRALMLAALSVTCAVAGSVEANAISMNPRDYYNGLYKTGVSSSGAKLGGNQADPHYRIVGFFNVGGYDSCQRFQNGGGGLTGKIIAPWRGSVAATTVNEYGGMAATWIDDKNAGGIVGNDAIIDPPSLEGTSPWGITSPKARWISHNQYGQHYNSTEDAGGDLDLSIDEETGQTVDTPGEICQDASSVNIGDWTRLDIWAYQTSFNITGDEDIIDYSTIQFNLSAHVDNHIAIQVNGNSINPPTGNKAVDMANGFVPLYTGSNSSSTSIWANPGFAANSPTVHSTKMSNWPFRYGKNTITVYIRTDYSHEGFMIDDINLTFDFNATVDLRTEIRARDKHDAWSLSDLSRIRPSDQLQWRHSALQRGPGNTNKTFTFYAEHARNGSTFLNTQIASWGSGKQPSSNWEVLRQEGTGGSNSWYVVQQADVGGKVCGRTRSSRTSNSNATPKYSNYVCADVPYHYPGCTPGDPDCSDDPPDIPNPNGDCTQNGTCPDVKPDGGAQLRAQSDVGETVMPGERVAFNYTINNSGPTKTKDIECRVYTFLMPATNDLPENWDHMATYPAGWGYVACGGRDVPANSVDYCEQVLSGWTGSIMPGSVGDGQPYKWQDVVIDKWLGQPGDRICSYIAANSDWSVYDGASSNSYAASNIACVRIGKRPQIQLNGSDSYAAGGFIGGDYTDVELNWNRGSYGQYGLLTNDGAISSFGSAGYSYVQTNNQKYACRLAFANSGFASSSGNCSLLGKAGIDRTIFTPLKLTGDLIDYDPSGGLAGLSADQHYYQYDGDLTIDGGRLAEGVRATIFVDGDVTINGNISTFNDNGSPADGSSTVESVVYGSPATIPSLTIIGETGNISISSNVTLVDANLVAEDGRFISCAGSEESGIHVELGINETAACKQKLKINGAVVSKESPVLHRTYGAGNTIGVNQWDNNMNSTTSEWFNYTPNTWLTPYLGGTSGINGYTTVQVTNLPVRY